MDVVLVILHEESAPATKGTREMAAKPPSVAMIVVKIQCATSCPKVVNVPVVCVPLLDVTQRMGLLQRLPIKCLLNKPWGC